MHVPNLVRNLTGNLVGTNRVLNVWLLESEVASQEDKRDRNTEPESKKSDQGGEWNGSGRLLSPNEEVEDKENTEDDARIKNSSQQSATFPSVTLEHLVQAGSNITGEDTHEDENNQKSSEQATTISRRQETKNSKHHGNKSHSNNLDTSSNTDREQHGIFRRTENITMNQLPAIFLLSFIRAFNLIVTIEILMDSTHHNHTNHTSEEKNDHERVDDGEPMDLAVSHEEINIPTRGPLDILGLPFDVVSPCN